MFQLSPCYALEPPNACWRLGSEGEGTLRAYSLFLHSRILLRISSINAWT